jgi:DNA transposition AAA+ family ATPase
VSAVVELNRDVHGDEQHERLEDELREWLKRLQERGVGPTTVAREIGVTHGYVSQFVQGQKSSRALVEKLQAFRRRVEAGEVPPAEGEPEAPAALPELPSLINTHDFQQVIGLCAMCREDGEIGVVVGAPGTGKTTAVREFCAREPEAAYVRADVTMSDREVLLAAGEALGLVGLGGTVHTVVKEIVGRLREQPAVLIVDEADLLVTRNSVRKLEIFRGLWDVVPSGHLGIVLVGLPRLIEDLVRGPSRRQNLSQFYSRVRRAYAMQGIRKDEVLEALRGWPLTDAAREYLVRAALNKSHGGLRRFMRLLQNVRDMARPGESITLDLVREADALLVSPASLGLRI